MYKPNTFFIFCLTLVILASSAFGYSPQFADEEKKVHLRWKSKKIPISISTSLFNKSNNIKAKTAVTEAINNSLESWESFANIEFEVSLSDKIDISEKGTSGDGASLITIAPTSENLLLFNQDIDEVSAITRLFYTKKGTIKEADIVLNPILLFSTDGTFRSFDLEATLTHEIGHLLGLGHSQVFGSTMHKHQGQNGVYNLPNKSSRTLSEDDKAGVISLYGKKGLDSGCCGTINGKVTYKKDKLPKGFHIWAEDAENGNVVAGVETDSKGYFDLRGLPESKFELFAQDLDGLATTISLGKVDLTKTKVKTINKEVDRQNTNFDVQFIGYNGQLSNLAVPVNAGKSYVIYMAGKNINTNDFEIGFHSTNFRVLKNSLLTHNYGGEISVISFEVQISEGTKIGDYSFYLINSNGLSDCLVGALTLEE